MIQNALAVRGLALLVVLFLLTGPGLAATRSTHAQTGGPAKIRVEITDSGFKGVAGNFSTEGGVFTVAVEPEQDVELTFVWAHQAYVDDAHVFVLKGYALETTEITASNREATLKFVASKTGTFDLKCNLECEVHERLVGTLKVARGVGSPVMAMPSGAPAMAMGAAGAPAMPMAGMATAMSVSVPETANVGQRVLLQARLVDSSGAPMAKAKVFFTSPTSFLNASGDVVVAAATTNAEGLAVAEYEVRSAGPLTFQAEFRGKPGYPPSKASAQMAAPDAPGALYVQRAGVRIPVLNAPPAVGPTMVGVGQTYGPLAVPSGLWPALSGWPIALALLAVWSLYASVVVLTFRVAAAGSAGVVAAERRPTSAALAPEPGLGHGIWSAAAVATAIVAFWLLVVTAIRGFDHALADFPTLGPYLVLVALAGGVLAGLLGDGGSHGAGARWAALLSGLGLVGALAALLSCCLWALVYRTPVASSLVLALLFNDEFVTMVGLAVSVVGLVILAQVRRPMPGAGVRV